MRPGLREGILELMEDFEIKVGQAIVINNSKYKERNGFEFALKDEECENEWNSR